MKTDKKTTVEKEPPEKKVSTAKGAESKGKELKGAELVERFWEEGWVYIKTVIDAVHEPILILDKNLCVLAANEPFYQKFQVEPNETEHELVYKLGNGQWDIKSLKNLLEDILPKNTFFKGFEVSHNFPAIGHKVMILNARQIHFKESSELGKSPIILLAIEDVTDMMSAAKKLADHTNQFEAKFVEQSRKMDTQMRKLEKEIVALKKK